MGQFNRRESPKNLGRLLGIETIKLLHQGRISVRRHKEINDKHDVYRCLKMKQCQEATALYAITLIRLAGFWCLRMAV